MAVITANNRNVQNKVAPAPALHDDGTNYEWRMSFDGNSTFADADNLDELIAILFDPDYTGYLTEDERLEARKSYAKRFQIEARSAVLGNLDPEDVQDIPDWEWDVLTYGEEEGALDPYGWGDGTGTLGVKNDEQIDFWDSKIPLVLVTTSYEPYTEIRRPLSTEGDFKYVKNIIWIRPETEIDFLRSLKHTGYISFGKPQAAPRPNAKALPDN